MPHIKDIIDPVMDEMKAKAKKIQARFDALKKQIKPEFDSLPPKKCDIHGSGLEKDWENTVAASYFRGKFYIVYKPCEECHSEEMNRKWVVRGIPKKVCHATFSNYKASNDGQIEALRRVKSISDKGSGFIICCGTPGTGKSHLLAAFLKVEGISTRVLMTTMESLITELRNTYEDGGKMRLIQKYRQVARLVIDEIDPKIKGDDIQLFLYEILAYRHDRGMVTGLGSNEEIGDVLEVLGEKIEDRMAQGYLVANFAWDSYRRKGE